MMKERTAKDVADVISNFVNGMGNNVNDVVEHLSREHRTLQQGFTRMAVAWLEKCAAMHKDGDFDLRNEASCELGKAFVEKLGRDERAVPFI